MFNTVPYNSFPASSELLQKLDAVAKAIDDMPTYTSDDRAFLNKWEVDLPILQEDVNELETLKANQITIAPTFSAETAYDIGDIVYYNGLTYRCTNAHEGEWDVSDFAATTINNELASLNSNITSFYEKVFFGGHYGKYYRTSQTAIDDIVDNVINPISDDTGYFSAENKASIVGFGNRQFVFGWTNTEKTFAWIIVCSFGGVSIGTRANASTFTFVSLTS